MTESDKLKEILQQLHPAYLNSGMTVSEAHSAICSLFESLVPKKGTFEEWSWNKCVDEMIANIERLKP